MVSKCQRNAYKTIWTVALLICLTEGLSGQTHLGLHFTQEELNIWRQRAQNGPYKTKGDVCANSPGDWERIAGNANAFLSNPPGERWKGQTKAVCVKPYDKIAPRREQGEKIRDAAFYFLITGHTRFRDAARNELLAQAAEPGSNFTDRTRWCLSLTGDPNPNFEITMWLNRQLFAYDYVRSTLSVSERKTLDSWFRSAALYWERAVDASIRQMYPKRNSDDYTTLGSNWQVETTQCTWYHCVTHYNGWKRVNWHEIWNNRDADMMRFAGLVGIMVDDGYLKTQAKRFFKEWMRHSVFPDGMAQEFIRWEEDYPSLGWAYASSLIGSMVVLADAFARIGDMELFQFSTSQGFSSDAGTMTPNGGPKNLFAVMTHHAKYVDKSIVRYGTDQASRNGNPAYIIGPVNIPNGEAWVNENFWMQANLYYRDPYLQSIYLRTAPDSHPYPANPSTGGWSGWTGCCGVYPGVLFMFGQMEGKVWPYPGTASKDGSVQTQAMNSKNED